MSRGVKYTIEDMQEWFEGKNVDILSTKFRRIDKKLELKCRKCNHVWSALPHNIKHATSRPCPKCRGKCRTIEDMHELAEKHGGKCLSKKYVDHNKTKLEWQCKNGHTWMTRASVIVNGSWCPHCCGNTKHSLQKMKDHAKTKNGKCLSSKYIDCDTNLKWQCEKGHIWHAVWNNMNRGWWCPYCGGKHQTIKDMQELAAKKRGKCLSKKYLGMKNKLKWQCKNWHQWETKPVTIKSGSWCPECSIYITERKCRFIFESLLKKPFKKTRKILDGLELDGYSPKLKLAFEYNGIQHYQFVKIWHKTKKQFKEAQQRDKIKILLCKQHKIELIIIPHYMTNSDKDLVKFIIGQLSNYKLTTNIDWEKF